MKILLAILLTVSLSSDTTLQKVRLAFQKARSTMEYATAFNRLMASNLDIDKDLKTAYYGASETLLAKNGGTIAERIALFKSGKSYIEIAVKNSPTNVEIRLVRLMIQFNAPSILGYHSDIEKDKSFIIKHFKDLAPDLKAYIKDIAKNTEVFSPEEKLSLK